MRKNQDLSDSRSNSVTNPTRAVFTIPEAAAALSISRRTLERLMGDGLFPRPVKIGRCSRVPKEDIANYLEQLRQQRDDKIGTS